MTDSLVDAAEDFLVAVESEGADALPLDTDEATVLRENLERVIEILDERLGDAP